MSPLNKKKAWGSVIPSLGKGGGRGLVSIASLCRV
ncbi:hypothetical protein M2273_004475 [Mucilaginibacter lappiensis]